MTESCQVAIIGAGVIGLAVARELARAGQDDLLIVERSGAPGQGSTARANGGVRAQFSTRANIEFSLHTIAELERLQIDTGGLPGFRQAGYLLMTATPDGEAALRRGYELQRSCGVPVEWLDPDAVFAIAPFIRPDGLRGATFCGRDGLIDPHGVVQALLGQVRRTAARIRLDHDVTAIGEDAAGFTLTAGDREIRARWLVNAAGPSARRVAAMVGVDLPCRPVRRNLACTDPVRGYPDVIPMCVDMDTGLLIRRESGGFLIAWSDPDDPPGEDTRLDPRFLPQVADRIGNRFPFLESAGIHERNCWAGLYPETPDHHAIIGPTPGHERFLQCVGFGGHGIMHSIAAGRAIAELVTDGRSTTLDLHALRFSRFAEGDLVPETAVL